MIRYTSHAAFQSTLTEIKGLRLEVYTAIKNWDPARHGPGPSLEDLANLLHRKESSMAGRVNELKNSGAIIEGPMKINRSNKPAMTYIALSYQPATDTYKSPQSQFKFQ